MTNYFDLTGRSALVTGAAGGIGSAVAQALADAGAAVLVTDLDKDAAAAVAERISANGGRAESAALDVSDRESADAAAAQAAALTDGALHIVINNAGVTKPGMFDKTHPGVDPTAVRHPCDGRVQRHSGGVAVHSPPTAPVASST